MTEDTMQDLSDKVQGSSDEEQETNNEQLVTSDEQQITDNKSQDTSDKMQDSSDKIQAASEESTETESENQDINEETTEEVAEEESSTEESESTETVAEEEPSNNNDEETESKDIVAEEEPASTEESTDEVESIDSPSEDAVQKEIPVIGNIASALKSDLRAQVETVLFVTDKPLKTGALATMLNASYDDIQAAVIQLTQEYEERNGGLEVGTEDGYIIQVRTQYLNIVTEMMPLEINPGPLRTLSAIALKEPCMQSEIVDMRGSSAYEQISELVEMELVSKKSQGMSYILKTTQKFKMYFRLSQEANKIKDKLQEQAKRLAKQREEKRKKEEEERLAEAHQILEGEAPVSSEQPKKVEAKVSEQKEEQVAN